MKKEISPAVAGVIVAIVVLAVGIFLWRGSQSSLQKDGKGGFEFKVEQDPAKLQAGLEKLKREGEESAKNH